MNFTYGPRATNIRIPNDFEARMTRMLVNAYEGSSPYARGARGPAP